MGSLALRVKAPSELLRAPVSLSDVDENERENWRTRCTEKVRRNLTLPAKQGRLGNSGKTPRTCGGGYLRRVGELPGLCQAPQFLPYPTFVVGFITLCKVSTKRVFDSLSFTSPFFSRINRWVGISKPRRGLSRVCRVGGLCTTLGGKLPSMCGPRVCPVKIV